MKNILFFGGGNIAQALISGLLLNGMSNKNIFFVDRNPLNQKKLNNLKVKSLKKSNSDKPIIFSEWALIKNKVKRRDFTLNDLLNYEQIKSTPLIS